MSAYQDENNKDVLARESRYWESHSEYQWASDESIRDVVRKTPPLQGDILEICCGAGAFTKNIPAGYKSYTCFDLSHSLLETLGRELPQVRTVQGDAEALEFPPGSFDAVLVFGGLHHLPNLEKVVRNIYRVLRSGGDVFAFEPNDDCWYRRFMLPLKGLLGLYTDDERFLKPAEVSAQFKDAGFADIGVEYLTPGYSEAHLRSKLNLGLAKLIGAAARVSSGPRWQTWFIIRGKKERR